MIIKCKAYVCNVKNCGAEMVVSSKIYTCIKDEKGWYWSTTKPSNFCCKNEDCGGNEQCKDNKCVPKCSRNQPSISLKEGEKLTLGCNEEKEITLEIKNEDQNCESSTFQISTSCEGKCTATLATSSLTVSSGGTGKTSIKIKPNSEKCENFNLNIIVSREIEKEKQEVTKEIQVEVSKEVTCSKKGEKCSDKQPCCEGLECIDGVCKEKEEVECKREYPSLKLEPDTQIAFPGEKLSYKLTIENKDDENYDSSDFQISIECPKEWKCELKKETIKIAPGKSFSTYVFISSPSSQEEGEYEIPISVINKENTKYKSEIYATYKIEGKTTFIPIFKGWNMISFPFSDAVLKIEDIKLAKCKIRKYAYAWNASLEKYERFTIFDERLRGRGFWVYSYNKCDLPVHGKNNLEAEEIVLLNKSKNQIPIPEEGLPLLEAKGNCEFINFTYWNASEQATYFWNASTHEFWKYNTTSKKYDIFVKVLDHPFFGKGESAFVYVKEGCSLGFAPPVAMRLKRS